MTNRPEEQVKKKEKKKKRKKEKRKEKNGVVGTIGGVHERNVKRVTSQIKTFSFC